MRRPSPCRLWLMAMVVALPLLAACASDGPVAPATQEAPPIHAELHRSRLFETQRQLKLVLRNDGDAPIAVESLQLRSPLVAEVPAQDRRSVLQPGRAVSMPVDFGESICGAPSDAESFVVLGIGGETHRIPLDQPAGALADVNEAECRVRRVFDAFDLGWGDDVTPAGEFAVRTTLELDRRTAGHVLQVDQVRSSVVITLEAVAGGPPSIGLDEGQDRASVDVVFNASRCDSHALTESKKTFVFAAFVRLDDEPSVKVELPAEGALREVLGEFIEACH